MGNRGDVWPPVSETTRLWVSTIEVQFEADTVADAEALYEQLVGRVLEHQAVWGVEGWFDREQKTETVDA